MESRKWYRAESGVWGLRSQGLTLPPASFVTSGKSPPLSELQPPLPYHGVARLRV